MGNKIGTVVAFRVLPERSDASQLCHVNTGSLNWSMKLFLMSIWQFFAGNMLTSFLCINVTLKMAACKNTVSLFFFV